MARLAAPVLALLAGCAPTKPTAAGASETLVLTVKNVDQAPVAVNVVAAWTAPGAHPTAPAVSGRIVASVVVPPASSATFLIRPTPDRLGVICGAGWPSHRRVRVVDYTRSLTVEVP